MSARVLVAGVGNVFFGDDGFGVAVTAQLAREPLPAGIVVRDVGVRGLHLAYELLDAPDLLIVVDLAPRGGEPGTLYVIDPELESVAPAAVGAHGLDLAGVLAALEALGGAAPPIRVVGCEPAELDERMELSAPVEAAIDGAVAIVRRLCEEALERASSSAPPTPNPEEQPCSS